MSKKLKNNEIFLSFLEYENLSINIFKNVLNISFINRSGVNDWESGSKTEWKHQMNLPSDSFFGNCLELEIHLNNVPKNLSAEVLGYYNRDHIKIDMIQLIFVSPTWISHPMKFQASNLGWTDR